MSSAGSRVPSAALSPSASPVVATDDGAGSSARIYLPGLTMTKVGTGGSGKALRRLRLRSCIFLICSGAESRGITESWIGSAGSEQSPTASASVFSDLTSEASGRS